MGPHLSRWGEVPLRPAAACGAVCNICLTNHSSCSDGGPLQVLLAVGPSHSFDWLKSRRLYFVVDLLSPWLSLYLTGSCLPPGARGTSGQEGPAQLGAAAGRCCWAAAGWRWWTVRLVRQPWKYLCLLSSAAQRGAAQQLRFLQCLLTGGPPVFTNCRHCALPGVVRGSGPRPAPLLLHRELPCRWPACPCMLCMPRRQAQGWGGCSASAHPGCQLACAHRLPCDFRQPVAHCPLHHVMQATWHSSPHTERVIRLSSCDAKRRFRGGACSYGRLELAWYHAGTAFDMAVHAAMLWLLSGCQH